MTYTTFFFIMVAYSGIIWLLHRIDRERSYWKGHEAGRLDYSLNEFAGYLFTLAWDIKRFKADTVFTPAARRPRDTTAFLEVLETRIDDKYTEVAAMEDFIKDENI